MMKERTCDRWMPRDREALHMQVLGFRDYCKTLQQEKGNPNIENFLHQIQLSLNCTKHINHSRSFRASQERFLVPAAPTHPPVH